MCQLASVATAWLASRQHWTSCAAFLAKTERRPREDLALVKCVHLALSPTIDVAHALRARLAGTEARGCAADVHQGSSQMHTAERQHAFPVGFLEMECFPPMAQYVRLAPLGDSRQRTKPAASRARLVPLERTANAESVKTDIIPPSRNENALPARTLKQASGELARHVQTVKHRMQTTSSA